MEKMWQLPGCQELMESFGGDDLTYALNSLFLENETKSVAQMHASMNRIVAESVPNGIPPGGVGFPLCFGGHFYGVVVLPADANGIVSVEVFDSLRADSAHVHEGLLQKLTEIVLPALSVTAKCRQLKVAAETRRD